MSESERDDCIFCQIVSGAAHCYPVHQDELSLAFMDIFPVAQGHTLVVTKHHYDNIFEASPEALAAVARSARRVAKAIRRSLQPDGLGVYQLNGVAAGQTVFHYHTHLIPRADGEALPIHGRVRGDDRELLEISRRIASALEDGD